MSAVIPGADGKTSVDLQVPDNGYVSYLWKKSGSDSVVGTQRILTVNQPGYYIVSVTEKYGCSSNFSPAFHVVNAKGSNGPDAANNLSATAISNTSIALDWSNNPTPVFNETAFEIYRSTVSGGPYSFAGQVPADTLSYIDNNLQPNVKYFYKIRAVNDNAAAALSAEANAITQSDKTPPTAPANLRVVTSNNTSVTLAWDSSTDNVGVSRYEIFVNGVKSYSTNQTTFVVGSLQSSQQYAFYVKAKDISGNYSVQSNQVSAATILQGLHYKYYEGSWSVLPNFNTLTPVKQGTTKNVDISVRNRDDQFAFLWEGYIRVPVTGSYTFETNSDDGSALWIGTYDYSTAPLVNNDGLHSAQYAGGTITLNAGVYPIAIAFFEQGGDQSMSIYWTSKAAFGNTTRRVIADSYFNDTYTPAGTVPVKPGSVTATALSYNSIKVNWTDKSTNETAFEIYRATSINGSYAIIGSANANTTMFTDSSLSPATTYYYKIQAVNQYGGSGLTSGDTVITGGLNYNYYIGTWSSTPNFATLTPTTTGTVSTFTLTGASGNGYGFLFAGNINIPTAGTYTFYTKSNSGSNLYIGGYTSSNIVVTNSFSLTAQERSGTKTLAAGTYPIYVSYYYNKSGFNFGSASLTVSYQGPGISKQVIPAGALIQQTILPIPSATTLALPAAPAKPTSVSATALSSSSIRLNWTDAANNEIEYDVYRSIGDTTKFKQIATLSANANTFTDSVLYAHITYYYKIKVAGVGGTANYSSIVSAKTFNNAPVLISIADRSARYDISTNIIVSANDADGDALSFAAQNLPAFASLVNNGDRTASLVVNPSAANQGVYNIKLLVNDGNGGGDTTAFNLTVNNNYDPVANTISDYSINEGEAITIPLSATDANSSDVLSWSVSNLPNTFSILPDSNGNASLYIKPGFTAAGVYTVTATVSDGNGGSASKQFTLTVNDKDPNTNLFIRFMDQDQVGSPWNSVTGVTTNNLKDATNSNTGIGLQFQDPWWAAWHEGPVTGNNSGVYPDAVLQDYYYFGIFGGPETPSVKVTGLDTSSVYNFTFYGGSVWSGAADNGTTTYTIGEQTVSLAVQNNTQNTVSINKVKPNADGTITFTMGKGANTGAGYLNALVISSLYDDGTAPAAPNALTAQNATRGVLLSWNDIAYNETGYEVYRAGDAGTFNLIGTTSADAKNFTDTTVSGTTKIPV